MASIYMKQKNFAKAIELYRKLQLKIPEKHDYFATLIKNMELSMLQK
jgi:tetratricopeptide (TPR) repeat protein